jgi:hypothetical protein
MPEFPYILTTNVLKKFIQEIPDTGIPEKLTQLELVQRGYRSGNHRPIIPILKLIKFLDESGKPTQNWVNYRDKAKSNQVMASCLRIAYSELFKTYPNAQDKDTEALRNFFSTRVKAGQQVLDSTVSTFRALADLADFGTQQEPPAEEAQEGEGQKPRRTVPQAYSSGLTVNLNIQLTLPATENAEIYDKLFLALKKHLLTPEK